MKSWYIVLPLLLVIASLGFAACTGGGDGQEYTHNILIGELGINEYSTNPPGKSTILPRAYIGAPPFVPHSLADLVITKDQLPCLVCHLAGLSFGTGHTATRIPESHYTDLSTGEKSENIQLIRFNCLLCHVPQSAENLPVE
jgi:cytochrome c-type protein NapB